MAGKKKNSEKRKGLPLLWVTRWTMTLAIAFVVVVNVTLPSMWHSIQPADVVADDVYTGDNIEAIARYTRILEADDANLLAYYGRAMAYMEDGYLDLARDDYNMFVAMDFHGKFINDYLGVEVNLAEAYFNRAQSYIQQGEYELAIADYESAIELKRGDFAEAYLNLYHAHYRLGQTDAAIVAYENYLAQTDMDGLESGCGDGYNGRSGH